MDRIREARRTTMAANGMTRRRHRTNSLRDSPEEDGAMELLEPTRLRDRGSGKKDRDRERDRDRDRDRERERDRLGRSKRRRGDRLMHGREDGGDDTSEESINDEEDEDEDDDGGGGGGSVRMLPLNPSSLSSSSSLSNHRKSFPPAKVFRPAPPTWKAADEMIGVSVPRKARSASTKRAHECWASSGGLIAEQIHRQASTSPVRTTAAAMGPSPSSSNVSVKKKMKPNGPKFRPPKSSSKPSPAQDEIEIEIAEVLYGMMRHPQGGASKQEIMANDSMKLDSREANKSSSDGKSRISSPISNSQSAPPQNSSSSATAVAPKRKRPRPLKHEGENPTSFTVRSSPISSITKAESDQPLKMETCSQNFDKNPGSVPENLASSQPVRASSEPQPESVKLEGNVSSDSKPLTEESEKKDVGLCKEVPHSPKKESPVLQVDDDCEDVKATKANPSMTENENQREEKFQIDLMAPPPPLRSSPERDVEINFVAGDPKPVVVDAEMEVKPVIKEDEKSVRISKEEVVVVEMEEVRAMAEDAESQKPAIVQKERGIDLQLDLEKADRRDTSGNGSMVNKKQHQNVQRHQHQHQQTNSEKNVQSTSVPLPMSVPSWPGGLPPMGYMTPLQGVVSMDGTAVTSAAIPPPHLFNQPRPKRCATHCYVARNILYHQQIARMNPFWPAAAGSASLYGAKPGNLDVVPSTELHGNVPSRATNPTQDKGHGLAMFPGHIGKEKGSQPANVDNSPRKQILLQQALPPGAAPSNILHGPAFIFPLNQQQAAVAASVRPGSVKSLPVTSNGASSSNSAPLNASATGAAAAPAMSFSYPNMPGLAILQNNAYPFPIPTHVGGPPAYGGTPAQPFSFFNGSFYPSQMLHPSQIQQQQLPTQSQQSQQGHPNTSISSGSSSSQKHAQNQQQKPNAGGSNGGGSGVGGGGGSLQGFPVTKNQSSQPLQLQQQQQQQQRQQLQNHHASHPARQIESEMGGEDSPSTADSRLSRATMNIYGQNFAMPMQTPNFALMTPASINGAGSNGSHGEKRQPQQHPGPKAGAETSQAFAMSFASINGATAATGLDLSSIAQNHSIMQSHHNYQIMAAAQAASAQHKKNYRVHEEGKTVVDSSNLDEERKAISGKIPATVGQSIAFSRPDVSDPSITALTGNNVMDSSGRSLNLGAASSRASVSVMPAAINTNAASSQQQLQRNQQQIHQLQKQHQFAAAAAAAARNKTPSTSNGNVYSDNLPSTSSMATKFPNAVSAFPQSLVHSSSTVAQSPQWKNNARATTSQSPPSMASTPPSSVKTLPQQQARSQQAHTQISFAANPKSSTAQVQPSSSTQSPSPPVMVGSPTTSSMSKNTGSPRTTSTSTNNKISQTSSLSSQQAKNSPAVPTRKSSPVGGRNVPSILSGPQLTPSSSTGSKSQLPQQQQQKQHQISKQAIPQAQLFFSNAYMHPQVSQSNSPTSTTSAASGYYLQRRGPEQMQRQGSSGTSSNGSAVNNTKGGGLPTQGLLHPAQFAAMPQSGNHPFGPLSFPYVHPGPTAVQVKPAEQKQPAGE